jgi:hypothetical protein
MISYPVEAAGLFQDSRRIGFAREWQERLRSAGYEVRDHCLIPLNGVSMPETRTAEDLDRHKTALSRYALSTPMQALGRYGYLDGSWSVFDYGCGKGDDVRILRQNGIEATGWDPHFAPGEPKTKADIVNLGFVINVDPGGECFYVTSGCSISLTKADLRVLARGVPASHSPSRTKLRAVAVSLNFRSWPRVA